MLPSVRQRRIPRSLYGMHTPRRNLSPAEDEERRSCGFTGLFRVSCAQDASRNCTE
jgi:hypothetical protein